MVLLRIFDFCALNLPSLSLRGNNSAFISIRSFPPLFEYPDSKKVRYDGFPVVASSKVSRNSKWNFSAELLIGLHHGISRETPVRIEIWHSHILRSPDLIGYFDFKIPYTEGQGTGQYQLLPAPSTTVNTENTIVTFSFDLSEEVIPPEISTNKVNILLLGDSAVGKSCLVQRFIHQEYKEVDLSKGDPVTCKTKCINISDTFYSLQLWDTAGSERFGSMKPSYYKNVQGIAIVYDVHNLYSFEAVQRWYQEVDRYALQSVKIVLVGNKTDLPNKIVSTEIAEEFATANEFGFFEVSALSGSFVEDVFLTLALKIQHKEPLRSPSLNDLLGKQTSQVLLK